MVIIPSVRKRLFFSISALIMGLLILFVFQAMNNYVTQKDILERIEERRLKINQIDKAVKLSEKIFINGKASQVQIHQLEQVTRQLLPVMHTLEGFVND